jgi:hypothetical protein
MFAIDGLTDLNANGSVEFVLFSRNSAFDHKREKCAEGYGSLTAKTKRFKFTKVRNTLGSRYRYVPITKCSIIGTRGSRYPNL